MSLSSGQSLAKFEEIDFAEVSAKDTAVVENILVNLSNQLEQSIQDKPNNNFDKNINLGPALKKVKEQKKSRFRLMLQKIRNRLIGKLSTT